MTEVRRVAVMSPQTEAARHGRAAARPLTELREQTAVGEVLILSLMRAQLPERSPMAA